MADPIPTTDPQARDRRIALILLCLTALNCAFQIAWFWRFRARNITMDGLNYIGLARHLLDGDFTASLHGYWSPLLSWLIAAGSLLTHDLTGLARVITIASFLFCLPLLYALTLKLWQSRVAAALAVLWFSLARGVIADAVTTIQADFLFVAFSILYFLRLLSCLRQGTRTRGTITKWNWFLLGAVHAAAFLAKAFAMPWLAVTTVLAVLAANRKSLKGATASLLLAFLVPAATWLTWGEVLKTKYGVFTTGYQLQANLATDLRRRLAHRDLGDPYPLADTAYDKYMVADRPDLALQFKMANPELVPMILANERRNVPAAIKEIIILLTPGGVIALAVGLALLTRRQAAHFPEATLAGLAVVSLATLIGAYCMLVFDTRYILPITPVLMAIAAYFLVAASNNPNSPTDLAPPASVRKAALALLLASMVFLTFYWASPFRTVDRDFQVSCYNAADLLKASQPAGETLVSIGDGPYPEHGIGFEAGPYVAYLANRRVTSLNSALPEGEEARRLADAVLGKRANAVLVWGKPADQSYQTILERLRGAPDFQLERTILDPTLGEVGRVVFLSPR